MKGLYALRDPDDVGDWRQEDALLMGTIDILQRVQQSLVEL
jgi:hypothetical protein